MIYITKQEGLYQNKVNSSLVSTCNCKMDYGNVILIAGTKLKFGTKKCIFKKRYICWIKPVKRKITIVAMEARMFKT